MGVVDAARQASNPYPFAEREDLRVRLGTVTARSGVQCSVRFSGNETALANIFALSSTAPSVGQRVWCVQFSSQTLILGTIGTDNVPYCRARRTSNQSLSNATETSVLWQSVTQNVTTPSAMWSSAEAHNIYARIPGWYAIAWAVKFASGGAKGGRFALPYLGSSRLKESGTVTGDLIICIGADIVPCVADDRLSLIAYQDGNTSLNILADMPYSISMIAYWIGPY